MVMRIYQPINISETRLGTQMLYNMVIITRSYICGNCCNVHSFLPLLQHPEHSVLEYFKYCDNFGTNSSLALRVAIPSL